MLRFLISGFGGLVTAAAFWAVFAFSSSAWMTHTGRGQREGGAGLASAFVFGPMGAVLGLVLGSWVVWRVMADPSRGGAVAVTLAVAAVAVVVGVSWALSPTVVIPEDFGPGVRPEFQVEVTAPAEVLGAEAPVEFQLRSGDGTVAVMGDRARSRRAGSDVVVPGVFVIRQFLRDKLIAVMVGGRQLTTGTLYVGMEERPEPVWSDWVVMGDERVRVRFRVVVPGR